MTFIPEAMGDKGLIIPLARNISRLRTQLAYAKRWAFYSRYYFKPTPVLSNGGGESFDLPPIVDELSGQTYLDGRHCCYQQGGLVHLENAVIASYEFSGCFGAWPIPLISVQGRGFTAEPQLTSSRAAMVFGRPKTVPIMTKTRAIAGEAFHLLGPFQSNWYHTLIDQLSLVARWKSLGLRRRGVRLIMPELWAGRWSELPQLIGVADSEIVWFGIEPIEVERLLLPVGIRVRSTSHTPMAEVAQTFANPDDIRGLRQLLLAQLEGSFGTRWRRVVIDRSDAWRQPRTQHFHVLADALTTRYGFERVVMGELRPSEQLKVFRDSVIVVAEHGAGLASFVAASKETIIVEVLPRYWQEVQGHSFNFIARCLGHRAYHTVIDAPISALLLYVEKLIDQAGEPYTKPVA